MFVLTSISPNHSNYENQRSAIDSWQKYGRCFSLNSKSEIGELKTKNFSGIEFTETHKTCEFYMSKKLVNINALFDFAIPHMESIIIVNSDIILRDMPAFKDDGVTLFSRYDYENEDFKNNVIFPHGWDVFHVPYKFLKIFPPSIYALGACFWDFWLPCICLSNNVPIYYPSGKFAFHKLHKVQYPIEEWYFLGEHFKWQFRYDKSLPVESVVTFAMTFIKSNFK